jgi:hypothetical protein
MHPDWISDVPAGAEAEKQTYSGRLVHPLNLHCSEVSLEDVAHHLAHINRWTGASKRAITVAEHSVHVSRMLPDRLRIYGLIHDAAEAYLGDVSTPIKRTCLMDGYRRSEKIADESILEAFDLRPLTEPDRLQVKEADRRMLYTEALTLMQPLHPKFAAELAKGPPPYNSDQVKIECWSSWRARFEFLEAFNAYI